MSDASSKQTLMALLALDADDSVAADGPVASTGSAAEPQPLPTLDQRTDMYLRAVYGPDHPVSAELRAAVRTRLIEAMSDDLADESIGPAPAAPFDPATPQTHRSEGFAKSTTKSTARSPASASAGLAQLWNALLQSCQDLLQPAFTTRGLRMAAVPLVALLIAGSVWTTGWINPSGDGLGTQGPPSLNDGGGASPGTRSRSLNAGPNDLQAEQNLRRDIAATEAKLGPSHPTLAQKLVDLASLLRSEGRYTEAEALCTRALAIEQEALGPRDPVTIRTIKELAMIYRAQGRTKEADDLLARIGPP
jgi:tetratricopeptide (TPR) repeat protein